MAKTKPSTTTRAKKSTPRRKIAKAGTTQLVAQLPGRCPRCDSTKCEPHQSLADRPISGTIPKAVPHSGGKFYNRVAHRRTRCSKCAHPRVDIFYSLET